jgi:hypothetical protein
MNRAGQASPALVTVKVLSGSGFAGIAGSVC